MTVLYLHFEDILLINKMSTEQHGGNYIPPHNFLHEDSLHYVLESVSGEMFGAPLYPTIADKAAVYMFSIISNHVFQDGNKRTGLEAALLFLKLNGYKLSTKDKTQSQGLTPIKPDELYNFTIEVAAGQHDLDAVRSWFAQHVTRTAE